MHLTVRNIPRDVMLKLKRLAKVSRRSLNSEILVHLEDAVGRAVVAGPKEDNTAQIAALRKLAGTWIDDRNTDEIIREIYAARILGRPIEL